MIETETCLDSRRQVSGIGSPRIRQFIHFRRVAMNPLELGEVVEIATRHVVDESLRRSAVGEHDLVSLGFDVIDHVSFAELRKRNAGYCGSIYQGSRFAKNAVDEHRVFGGDGQIAMRQNAPAPPPPPGILRQSEPA